MNGSNRLGLVKNHLSSISAPGSPFLSEAMNKILIVTQNLPPAICGVGDYATLFAQELVQQNPELKIAFLTRPSQQPGVNYAAEGIAQDFLNQAEIYPVAPFQWKLKYLPSLLKTVRQSGATTIHIHYVPQMYYRAGVGIALSVFGLLLRLMGLHLVVTFHELYIPGSLNLKLFLIGLIQRLSFFLLLIAANEIVVTTGLRAQLLRRWLWGQARKAQKIVVEPVGSNFPASSALSNQQVLQLRQKWGLPSTGLVLSCVGQLRLQQPEWLLATLKAVQIHQPEACLLLIGNRADKLPPNHPLRQQSNVIFTGHCSASEVSTLLSLSSIYLLPLDDGVSGRRTALVAALQHGLPIVSTKGHNTEPAFTDALPLLLAPVSQPAEFVRLATELANNPAKRLELGRQAQAYYQTNFAWEKIVKSQSSLFTPTQKSSDALQSLAKNAVSKEKSSASTILFINGVAERGGGEVVLQNTVTHLDLQRFRPVVVFLRPGSLVAEFQQAGITTYLINAGRFSNPLLTVWTIVRLLSLVKREKIDIVQSAGGKCHLYGGMVAFIRRKPAILLLQENSARPGKWDVLAKFVPTRMIITNSNLTMQTARKFFPKVEVGRAYPGVETGRFETTSNPQLRAELGLQPNHVAIGIFARLQHWKGVHVFIDAADLVRHQFPQARFFIVGDTLFGMEANYRTDLQAQIARLGVQEWVQMLGYRQDVPELMRAMDVIVSSSVLPEGFGITVVEAMLTGRAVVASAHGGPTEIIHDKQDGFLVPPGDAQALADQLLKLITDPQLRQQTGQQARASAISRFSVKSMLEQFQALYSDIEDDTKKDF